MVIKNPLVETVSTGDGLCIRRIGKERRRVSKEEGAGFADQNGKARIVGIRGFSLQWFEAQTCFALLSHNIESDGGCVSGAAAGAGGGNGVITDGGVASDGDGPAFRRAVIWTMFVRSRSL
jgi:hypothetical protein